MIRLLLILSTIGLLSLAGAMDPTTETPEPVELDILPVEHLAEYVIGFPVHVAITIRAHPQTSFNMMPFADFLNLRSCIGAEITSPGGEPIRYRPKPFVDRDSGRPGGKLGPGEARRMLADVSPYFADIAAGSYQVRFSYIDTDGIYDAAPVTLRFRKPTGGEAALLAAAAADRPEFSDWGAWTITCPPSIYSEKITADNPLRFNLLLRRLLCGPEPPERVDPSILDVFTGLYAPEGKALRAELYQARGDTVTYRQLRSAILRDTPGLMWWMRMTDGDGAFIKSIRLGP